MYMYKVSENYICMYMYKVFKNEITYSNEKLP